MHLGVLFLEAEGEHAQVVVVDLLSLRLRLPDWEEVQIDWDVVGL